MGGLYQTLIINKLAKSFKININKFGNMEKFSDLYCIRVEGIPLPQFKTKKTKVMNKIEMEKLEKSKEFKVLHNGKNIPGKLVWYEGIEDITEIWLNGKFMWNTEYNPSNEYVEFIVSKLISGEIKKYEMDEEWVREFKEKSQIILK
jgi:hypothetical protein